MTKFVRFAAVALAASALYASPSYAASDVAGKWNIVADVQGQQFKSTMMVVDAGGGAYTVDVQPEAGGDGGPPPMKSTVSEAKIDGEVLSFKQHIDGDQFKLDLTYKLTVAGATLAGEASMADQAIPITGTRAQ